MTLKSAADVATRMTKVAEAARTAQKVSVQRAAGAMKDAHLAGLDRDTAGRRLRNAGKKGAKLNVGYTLKGGTDNPSAIVEARGPWQLLNNPAKPHEIGPKGKGKKAHRAIRFGNTFRASVHHPGHRGKRTWQRAEPAAAKAGASELNKTMVKAVQQAFKG